MRGFIGRVDERTDHEASIINSILKLAKGASSANSYSRIIAIESVRIDLAQINGEALLKPDHIGTAMTATSREKWNTVLFGKFDLCLHIVLAAVYKLGHSID